jgi:ABC-type Na+ transport system ATPase subunit NatA/ABC-type multidrug transport system permease subunit
VLWCRDLRRRFGERLAVDGVGFEVGPGETYGLLGPNGAGKTTTISMICGLLSRDGGEVQVAGASLDRDPGRVKAAIGYVPQDVALYPDLSGLENLRFWGRMYGLAGPELSERVGATLEVVGLAERAADKVGGYSGGMQRRLNIAAGLLHRPRLLVLDEPTAGVDPQSRNAILAQVKAARAAAEATGTDFDAALADRARAAGQERLRVEAVTVGGRADALPAGFNYTAPANLVLFVFITSLAGAATLIEARRLGVTRRLLATPTTATTILFGEALGRFAVALLQGLIVFGVGWLVFGVDWGEPPAALLLVVTFALVATGVGMLLGSVLRNAEQATSIGPPVGIALGMLGGCMWPLAVVPAPMRAFGHLFPHAWAMDAFIALIARDAGLAGIARELAVLAAFAAALLALASWRLRRALVG